ncbi:hypothetical protein GCM10009731_05830 [Streptomyces globosus]
MTGPFFIPAAASHQLPDVICWRSRRTAAAPGEADPGPPVAQPPNCPGLHAAGMLRVPEEKGNVSQHDDAAAAESALRKAVEQLYGDAPSDGSEAAAHAPRQSPFPGLCRAGTVEFGQTR